MINNMLNILLDDLPFGLWIRDKKGNVLFENREFKYLDKMIKLNIIDIIKNEEKSIKDLGDSSLFETWLDGKVFEIQVLAMLSEDDEVIITSVIKDITNIKNRQSSIVKEKDILQTIINNIPELICYKDINGRYIGCNDLCSNKFIGKEQKDIVGKNDAEILSNHEIAEMISISDKKVIETKEKICEEIKFELPDKSMIYMESKKAPIINNDNEIIGTVCIARDITDTKMYEEKLKKLSYTDKLTGLYNRAYLDYMIDEIDKEKYLPISIIMGDINGLKIVNDALGHKEGDNLIISISNIVKDNCPEGGLVFRWGGDEIIVLLPNTSYEEGILIKENIMNDCENTPYEAVPYNISLGNACKDDKSVSIYHTIKEAEEKMYRKKLLKNKSVRSSIINSLKKSLEEKNIESKEHIENINNYALKIGSKLKLDKSKLDEISLLASLHDIGKISIPENILRKTTYFTDEERKIIKSHTEIGFRIAKSVPELSHISRGILTHHERWDGKGYPLGLKEEEIPLISRIFSIAEYYDKLLLNNKLDDKKIREYIIENSGSIFDPNIASIFLNEIMS